MNTDEHRYSVFGATSLPFAVHVIAYVLLGICALLLRVADLGVFLSGDEADFWIPRSERFLAAIQSGNFIGTAISTHPGVTTMWLGSMGIMLRRFLFESGILQDESFAVLLALYRLPTAFVHTLGILAGYAVLRRLFPATVALLAAILWATDPFVLAFSRVLHVDGLVGTFATLSLLLACLYWNHEQRMRWVLLSGMCAGLAILSKSPALLLGPAVGGLALVSIVQGALFNRKGHKERKDRTEDHATLSNPSSESGESVKRKSQTGRSILAFLFWCVACLISMLVVWPAMWSGPVRVYELLRIGVEVEGGSPHMMGNFFLGQHIDDPGWLFYPVALVMRTTPWVLVGLLLLPLAIYWNARRESLRSLRSLRFNTAPVYRTLAFLAGFVVLFTVAMSIFPKKFNRYLIPAFPAIDILAAWSIVWVGNQIAQLAAQLNRKERKDFGQEVGSQVRRGVVGEWILVVLVSIAAVINAVWYHPYGIAYFNQLTGGAQAGAETFVVGWGEGYEQVADFLNQQDDITGVVTLSKWGSSLNAYLRRGAQANGPDNGRVPDATGYVVVYIRHVLGGQPPTPPFDQFYGHAIPLHTVTIHGVEYAWVYHMPPPVEHIVQANVGPAISLRGYTIEVAPVQPTDTITLTLQWQTRTQLDEDYNLFIHVFDAQGEQIAQVDVPAGSSASPTHTWQPGRYITRSYPLALPPHEPGTCWMTIGLYDPATFARLPIRGAGPVPPGAPDDGPDALVLKPFVAE